MARFDVFNGDADGICALHQLRLADPGDGELITGVKRDISLLGRVEAQAGDEVTVLDVSLDKNRDALTALLERGVTVSYFDHHFPGEIPTHAGLRAHIDPSPEVCTSLLVDAAVAGAHRPWAVAGAFGDNLYDAARRAAAPLGLDEARLEALRELGTLLNYNGYGVELSDLFFPPADLYRALRPYADPFAFIAESPAFEMLRQGYRDDTAHVAALRPELADERCALFILPDAPWARRVSGVLGNDLARENPARAHALLTELPGGDYRISVRAPLTTKEGADDLCRAFPTGGGRKAAAGINALPRAMYDEFVERFRGAFG